MIRLRRANVHSVCCVYVSWFREINFSFDGIIYFSGIFKWPWHWIVVGIILSFQLYLLMSTLWICGRFKIEWSQKHRQNMFRIMTEIHLLWMSLITWPFIMNRRQNWIGLQNYIRWISSKCRIHRIEEIELSIGQGHIIWRTKILNGRGLCESRVIYQRINERSIG